jgi:lipid II:glycine glycyltransferase (peptidoglycan interpeptide bridge formation enzyme)
MVPMSIRYATNEETQHWDEHLTNNPDGGNVFQASEMAEAKRQNGWTPRYLMADDIAITVLEKRIPILGKFWYLPKGPGVTTEAELLPLIGELSDFARARGVFVAKIEPEILESEDTKNAIAETGLVQTSAVQPNVSTVIIDTAPELDKIIASFNQKGRNALRRAEREGVIVQAVEASDETMLIMYRLLTQTAAGRFDSSLRSFEYYKKFWQNYTKSGHGSFFFATYDGHIIAGAFCMYIGTKGLYKDGASLREKVVYGASHLLQWEVIKWMKERGVTSYDLCGSPHSTEINDPDNPFHGIGRFKTSFNKHVTDYVGCYDIVIRPRAYKLWKQYGRRIVTSLSWRIKHQQWL